MNQRLYWLKINRRIVAFLRVHWADTVGMEEIEEKIEAMIVVLEMFIAENLVEYGDNT